MLTCCLDVPLDHPRHRRDGTACVDEVHGSKTQPALPVMTHACRRYTDSPVKLEGKATLVLLKASGVVATKNDWRNGMCRHVSVHQDVGIPNFVAFSSEERKKLNETSECMSRLQSSSDILRSQVNQCTTLRVQSRESGDQ